MEVENSSEMVETKAPQIEYVDSKRGEQIMELIRVVNVQADRIEQLEVRVSGLIEALTKKE